MDKPKVLVTGANGFMGRVLLKELMGGPYHLSALDYEKSDSLDHGAVEKFYQQDITKPFFLDEGFDFVFHLAAYNVTHVGERDTPEYYRVNVKGTEHVLKSARIKNFVFMSTAKVYRCEGRPLNEDSPLGPIQDYEKSKLEAEKTCREFFKGQNLCIFRSVNVVGPGQAPKAVIPVLFKKAMAGKPLEIFGPKESFLQMLFVDDVMHIFKRVLVKDGMDGIYNLSSQDKIRLDELAHEIVHLCNSPSAINFTNTSQGHCCEVISQKARKTFNWKPRVRIKEILKRYHGAVGDLRQIPLPNPPPLWRGRPTKGEGIHLFTSPRGGGNLR